MKIALKKLWWLAASVLISDIVTKAIVMNMAEPVVIIPKLLEIHPVTNHGIAFGMLQLSSRIMGIATAVILAAAMVWLWKKQLSRAENVALVLLVSGAFCNMLERIFLAGVLDFIKTAIFPFAIFNVADVAVVAGCVMMGICWMLPGKTGK